MMFKYISLVCLFFMNVAHAENVEDPCAPGKYDRNSMLECQNISIEKTDKRLNLLYQQLLNRLTEEKNIERLRDAQRAWLKFIELDCVYEQGAEEGREWALMHRGCIDRHKQQRVKELEAFVACTSNGCPE